MPNYNSTARAPFAKGGRIGLSHGTLPKFSKSKIKYKRADKAKKPLRKPLKKTTKDMPWHKIR